MTVEHSDILEIFSNLERQLRSTRQKLMAKLEKQQKELNETTKHIWYKQIGDSLLSMDLTIPKKSSSIEIINVHTETIETVPLNPKEDLKKNAELYYKKAKKAKRGAEISEKKVCFTENEILQIDKLLADCAKLNKSDSEEISRLSAKASELLHTTPQNSAKDASLTHKTPYRHFTINTWNIYIGKNDTQNDEISTRFAAPSDLWFHVAGHAGSHVIIRRPKNTEPPPREVIEKTAALSVWFSKARHTSYTEVHYTEARFVHKRRHAPAGEVIAERCKSIRVSPRSPHDLFPSEFLKDDQ